MPDTDGSVLPGRKAPPITDLLNTDGTMKTDNSIADVSEEVFVEAAGDEAEEVAETPETEAPEGDEEVIEEEAAEDAPDDLTNKTPAELAKMLKDTQAAFTRSQQELADLKRQPQVAIGDVDDLLPAPMDDATKQQVADQRLKLKNDLYAKEIAKMQAMNPYLELEREDPNVPTAAEQIAWQEAEEKVATHEMLYGAQQDTARRGIPALVTPVITEALKDFPATVTPKDVFKAIFAQTNDPVAFLQAWNGSSPEFRAKAVRNVAAQVLGEQSIAARAKPVQGKPQPVPKTGGGLTLSTPGKVTLTMTQKTQVDKLCAAFPSIPRAKHIANVKAGKK